jgi:NAD(P)H-nitrite reductase large subunit
MTCINFLIIGSGIAGMTCAEELQKLISHQDTIRVLSSSGMMKRVVNVVQLTRYLESFDIEESSMNTYSKEENESYPKVDFIQTTVKKLNTQDKKIIDEKGVEYQYDLVCLCSGAKPKLIAEHHPNVIGIRDIESVLVCYENDIMEDEITVNLDVSHRNYASD